MTSTATEFAFDGSNTRRRVERMALEHIFAELEAARADGITERYAIGGRGWCDLLH